MNRFQPGCCGCSGTTSGGQKTCCTCNWPDVVTLTTPFGAVSLSVVGRRWYGLTGLCYEAPVSIPYFQGSGTYWQGSLVFQTQGIAVAKRTITCNGFSGTAWLPVSPGVCCANKPKSTVTTRIQFMFGCTGPTDIGGGQTLPANWVLGTFWSWCQDCGSNAYPSPCAGGVTSNPIPLDVGVDYTGTISCSCPSGYWDPPADVALPGGAWTFDFVQTLNGGCSPPACLEFGAYLPGGLKRVKLCP